MSGKKGFSKNAAKVNLYYAVMRFGFIGLHLAKRKLNSSLHKFETLILLYRSNFLIVAELITFQNT